MKADDVEVIVFRRPNMFNVQENLYNLIGYGELQKLFTIENYECEEQELVLYYPERFLNIVEQRVLLQRIEDAKNYKRCQIITSSAFIIQSSKNVRIHAPEGENLKEEGFNLSTDFVGLPNDGGLGIL